MGDINSRILDLINALEVSKNQFAKNIQTSSAMISKVTNQKTNFGKDIIEKIITAYPDLNAGWLLTGVGEMWLKRNTQALTTDIALKRGKQLTSMQSRLLFNSCEKVQKYLQNLKDDLSGLYELIGDFEGFRSFVAKEISEKYFEDLYNIVFDNEPYLDGNSFRLEDCKKAAYAELANLKPLQESLKNLNIAISIFYKEFGQVDTKNAIANTIGPHVL